MAAVLHPSRARDVVLLHASTSSSRQWDTLAERLRPHWNVHRIDLLGHGAAALPPGGTLTLADDVAQVLPLLRDSAGVHLVGHSYGAAVALRLATLCPQAVHSVVAYEPVLFHWLLRDGAPSRPLVHDIVALATEGGALLAAGQPARAAQRFVEFWSGAGAWALLPERTQAAVIARVPAARLQFDALMTDPPEREALAALATPMLFLTGAETVAVTRRVGELLRQALPRARHETLPGLGHMGPITHPEPVNQRIERFLCARVRLDAAARPLPATA